MKESIPLSFLRIWCRERDAWLSFKTKSQERFLVNPTGFYIELPDGSLTPISPRLTFPTINRYPSVVFDSLAVRSHFGPDSKFISVPMRPKGRQAPVTIQIPELTKHPLSSVSFEPPLEPIEEYVLVRAIEHGAVNMKEVADIAAVRKGSGKTVGQILLTSAISSPLHWEQIFSYSLDGRPISRLDPPELKTVIERREWELVGEILYALRKIKRTQLEQTLRIKREGTQALGQILTAMGACPAPEIENCLKMQEHVKEAASGGGVVLIGNLLVSQGIIDEEDLESVLRNQSVARQPLGKILLGMGSCTAADLETFERNQGGSFQPEIDDQALAKFLLETGTITRVQLEEAQRLQQRGRQVLGEMVVAMGLCTARDIEKVLAMQHEIKEHAQSGVQKLGEILIKKGHVPADKIDQAVHMQSIARQPFGAILTALGACSAQDIRLALDIQKQWRHDCKEPADRLGEVLVRAGIISESQLREPLQEHIRDKKPLGAILVEKGICTPEQIVDILITRDLARRDEFMRFVEQGCSGEKRSAEVLSDEITTTGTHSVVEKISSWLTRAKKAPR